MARGLKTGGRKKGAVNKATVARRILAASDSSPLEILLENARYFREQAIGAEQALAALKPEMIEGLNAKDQFNRMLAEVKKAAGLRELAGVAAKDAAPYVHPRLQAVEHTGPGGGPIKTIGRIELVAVQGIDAKD